MSLLWCVRRCVQIWIALWLFLHLELGKKCLFKLCLLRRANWLARDRGLHVVELVEEVLVKVVAIEGAGTTSAEVHRIVCSICALMT